MAAAVPTAPAAAGGGASSDGGAGGPARVRVCDTIDERDVRECGRDAVWSVSSAKPGHGVVRLRDGDLDATYWQSDGAQPHTVTIAFARTTSVCEVAFYVDVNRDESYTPQLVAVLGGSSAFDVHELRRDEIAEPTGWVRVPLARPRGTAIVADDTGAALAAAAAGDDDGDGDESRDAADDDDADDEAGATGSGDEYSDVAGIGGVGGGAPGSGDASARWEDDERVDAGSEAAQRARRARRQQRAWARRQRRRVPVRLNVLQLAVLQNHESGRDTHIRQVRVYTPRTSAAEAVGVPELGRAERDGAARAAGAAFLSLR